MKTNKAIGVIERFKIPLLSLLMVISITSCQQEGESELTLKENRTAKLQEWLATDYPDAKFNLDWKRYHELQINTTIIARVALINLQVEGRVALHDKEDHHTWLEILINNRNIIQDAYIYAVVPSISYIKKSNFSCKDVSLYNLKDFEGAILMYHIDGTPIQMKVFAEGRHVRNIAFSRDNIDEHDKIYATRAEVDPRCELYHKYVTGACPVCLATPCDICKNIDCKGECEPKFCNTCGVFKSDCICVTVCPGCSKSKSQCNCGFDDPDRKPVEGGSGGIDESDPANYCGKCNRLRSVCNCEIPLCFSCLKPDDKCTCFRED